jgi:Glycosyltransferase family 92
LLSPQGKDTALFWTSTLRFRCPVPGHLQNAIVDGLTMLRDGTATVHVDVVPIRTSVRYQEVHFSPEYVRTLRKLKFFDAATGWGPNNVLPLVDASGRWENIPVCPPPKPVKTTAEAPELDNTVASAPQEVKKKTTTTKKQHTLTACLWSSAVFKHRGETTSVNSDTIRRIQEWIEFHLMVGFDHIYVYDNSGAHSNETSLGPLLNHYSQVTRIDWPSTVCNNNKPMNDSSGERSSQYAAEASCLA